MLILSIRGNWFLNNWFLKAGFYFIDNNTGRNRRILKLSVCELSQEQKKALLGLHAFGGNDFVSCIFQQEALSGIYLIRAHDFIVF